MLQAALRPLAGFVPVPRTMLDLVSVAGPTPCVEEGLARLRSAPRWLFDHEIAYRA